MSQAELYSGAAYDGVGTKWGSTTQQGEIREQRHTCTLGVHGRSLTHRKGVMDSFLKNVVLS